MMVSASRRAACVLGISASLLLACADANAAPAPPAKPTRTASTTLTKGDAGKTFTLASGATFRFELAGNRTTGYAWQASQNGSTVTIGKSTYTPDAHPPGFVGYGGKEIFPCKAVATGTTTIRLVYRQPWKGGGVGERVNFKIVVR